MPWACAVSSFLPLVIGLTLAAFKCQVHLSNSFFFLEHSYLAVNHNPSEQHYQTQCDSHLNNASCGKQSLISFGIVCFAPWSLFAPDLPATCFSYSACALTSRGLCCSILSWKRAWALQRRAASVLARLVVICMSADGLTQECEE